MKVRKSILCALMLIVLRSAAHAAGENAYCFRLLDTAGGLSDNNVRSMLMLPGGLMCIQTASELNFYDGAACRCYSYDPAVIPYTEYSGRNEMWYDGEGGRIWLSSRDRLWAFDMKRKDFDYSAGETLSEDTGRLFVDSDGRMWKFSTNGSVRVSDVAEFRIKGIEETPVAVKQQGDLVWILSRTGILASYDIRSSSIRDIKDLGVTSGMSGASRAQMEIDRDGIVYIMSDRSIVKHDPRRASTEVLGSIDPSTKDLYTAIAIDARGCLWTGTARSGVSIISPDGKRTSLPYLETTDGRRMHRHSDINKIYADPQGGVWIATQTEGLLYWHRDIIRIRTVNRASSGMADESVKCLAEAPDGSVLVGTIRGLFSYNPETGSMRNFCPQLKDELCISLYVDDVKRVWVGTFYNGLYCIDGSDIRHYAYPEFGNVEISYLDSTPNYNCVRCLTQDSAGRFWISVYGGLGRFDEKTGNISLLRDSHPELEHLMLIRNVTELPDGTLSAVGDNGQFIYDVATDRLCGTDDPDFHALANQVSTDNYGNTWKAGGNGLVMITPEGEEYTPLPDVKIMSIAEDRSESMWVATFNALARVKTTRSADGTYAFTVQRYGRRDGIDCGTFFQNSSLAHSDGKIFFGGTQGLCIIEPQSMHLDNYGISPVISEFLAGGREMDPATEKIRLRHDESSVTFNFTNLNYANPEHTIYRYCLGPSEKQWKTLTSVAMGTVSYTFLPPGDYTFSVQAAINGADWSEPTTVSFTVTPPFYRSTIAHCIYAAMFLLAVAAAIFYLFRRTRSKIQREIEEDRRRKQDELNELKFQFFTNISHELRTPLSLILLPLESLMEKHGNDTESQMLETMHRNAEDLLGLVNNILDFKKVETAEEKLHLSLGDISEFVGAICEGFRDGAQRKGVELYYEDELAQPMLAFDGHIMKRILGNLLSNAIKFTPEGGSVNVRTRQEDGCWILEVTDSGIGIPETELDRIFDRFYRSSNAQENTGSGIGLHMVKHYTSLHEGTISVKSVIGEGTSFSLRFPVVHECADEEIPKVAERPAQHSGEDKPRILVVDDNTEWRNYLAGELSEEYVVTQAADGEQCLEIIEDKLPDIVVCDVMMPKKDGFQVTKAIKNNVGTSHIPVILLTARMSEDTRQEGYETGADSYLTKPFKMDLLKARLRNLLEDRQRRQRNFSASADVSPMHLTITTVDQKLMARIIEKLDKNISDPNYSVEDLAGDVGMHRMNLYRKIQSLFSMTPSEFIRTMRLKRAAQIITDDPNLPVSEVAEMVGFNTTKYFTKYFREMFGTVPSQYGKKNEN